MTDTLVGMSPPSPAAAGDAEDRASGVGRAEDRDLSPAELAAVQDLVRQARAAGVALTGPDGLLKAMT
ncbi:IS256 family transposase, partial [Naumannella sp. ID2617S]|nr:IS256 family transposase [Naumannella sp. ID2617S]